MTYIENPLALLVIAPPNAPKHKTSLFVRFVHHGCLVVSAWGDEAAELNAAVNASLHPKLPPSQ